MARARGAQGGALDRAAGRQPQGAAAARDGGGARALPRRDKPAAAGAGAAAGRDRGRAAELLGAWGASARARDSSAALQTSSVGCSTALSPRCARLPSAAEAPPSPACSPLLQVSSIETGAEALSALVFHSFHLLLVTADTRGYLRVQNAADGSMLNTFHVSNGEGSGFSSFSATRGPQHLARAASCCMAAQRSLPAAHALDPAFMHPPPLLQARRWVTRAWCPPAWCTCASSTRRSPTCC